MSSAEKRSAVDGEDGEIADLRELGLELGTMESDAMGRLSTGGVCEAQERGNSDVLVEIDDTDTNEDPKIDNGSNDDPSTKNSGHDPGQDFSIRSDIDEGRERSSCGGERNESTETHVLDDSGGYNVNNESDVDVDEHDDDVPLVEHEESEEEESSDDCNSDNSDILSKSEINDPLWVRWPITDPHGAKESMESENEMNTTTTEVLNPDLCKFCRVFFDTWSSVCDFYSEKNKFHVLFFAHYDTMSDLRASASGGCHLCSLSLSILSFGLRKYDFSANDAGDNFPLDQLRPEDIVLNKGDGYDCKIHDEREYEWTIVFTFRPINDDQREISTWTRIILDHASDSCYIDGKNGQNSCEELRLGTTEESTGIVRAWIRECHLNHSACKQQDTLVLPTRLIKIDSQEIRLWMSSDENCSEYATLSHCWGKTEVLRLQKDNLQDFLIKIPYNKLCKTFRDAIDIARVLGFSWLWIDSLCIVQDDPEDWSKEASRMATVYGLSSLNIAATAAPDGTIGCLFDRDLRYTEKHKVEVKMDRQKQVYSIADNHLYSNNIVNAALTKRAWAFQERILSPRTLHFTESQLFWECRTNQACEIFPDILPEAFHNDCFYLPKRELLSWSKIVQIYTGCSLTNESDRLIAIGGVARQYQKKNGDRYFAGLWQSRIREQMCWYVLGEYGQHPRETPGRAPSWSWAAVNHSVSFPRDTKVFHEAYIDVTKIDMTLENADDSFGGVKSGVLTLRSRLMMIFEMESRPNTPNNYRFGKFPISASNILWDHRDCGLESYSESILILPIGALTDSDLIFIEALLLICTNQENGQYNRVGCFHVHRYPRFIRRAMNLTQDEQFKELGLGDALPSEKDYISTDVDEDGITWYTISIA